MAQGLWTLREAQMHINILELQTAHLACWAFLPLIRFRHIQLLSDDMMALCL